MPSRICRSITGFLFALSATGLFLIAAASFGLGITDDSVNYLAAAMSFPQELKKADNTPFVEWPPLFPIILSVFQIFKLPILRFALIIQALSLFFSYLIIYRFIQRYIQSSFFKTITSLVFLFSTPIFLIHIFLWSEGLFLLFSLLSITFLDEFLKTTRKWFFLVALLFFSILMTLIRKNGIMLSGGFLICLLILPKSLPTIKKILLGSTYIIIASLPFFLYLGTRKKTTGRFFTEAGFDAEKIGKTTTETLNIITSWIFPDEVPLWLRIAMLSTLLTCFLIINVKATHRQKITINRFEGILLITTLVYSIWIIIGFLFVKLDQEFDDRIFAPMYFPFMFLFLMLAEKTSHKLLSLSREKNFFFTLYLPKILIIIWLVYPIIRTCFHLQYWYQNGPGGYNSAVWRNNTLIKWLQKSDIKSICTEHELPFFYFLNVKKGENIAFNISQQPQKDCLIIGSYSCKIPKNAEILFNSPEGVVYRLK